uniref:Uncharacterized protein n=1 Tax=Chromera velia CCMP2878 TaxID=1169474 RepID=A0A0G4FMY9_9ALVE|eukprot:Cvel_17849.t1-p1 / transcript=Cvel_17849.t1 / gene=Cvel_17849 / organism=Chromera_velia_CCMP2878 / gene_product=E3 ubiquitin-protein ligase XB3, putative / transcript_product=E3 ubiquitin-protein ligase XB3, putative / location=Cvel_scaffold1447:26145-27632(+) / protein_length=496 / sequence_SO=supercontig / SO=protein_coding / is_pseudo=false
MLSLEGFLFRVLAWVLGVPPDVQRFFERRQNPVDTSLEWAQRQRRRQKYRLPQNAEETHRRTALCHYSIFPDVDMCRQLLREGADSNELGCKGEDDGWAPIHCAASHGNAEILLVLLEGGALVNLRTSVQQQTALHCAALSLNRDCVLCLLAFGADPRLRDVDGHSPLDFALAVQEGEGADSEGLVPVSSLLRLSLKARMPTPETSLLLPSVGGMMSEDVQREGDKDAGETEFGEGEEVKKVRQAVGPLVRSEDLHREGTATPTDAHDGPSLSVNCDYTIAEGLTAPPSSRHPDSMGFPFCGTLTASSSRPLSGIPRPLEPQRLESNSSAAKLWGQTNTASAAFARPACCLSWKTTGLVGGEAGIQATSCQCDFCLPSCASVSDSAMSPVSTERPQQTRKTSETHPQGSCVEPPHSAYSPPLSDGGAERCFYENISPVDFLPSPVERETFSEGKGGGAGFFANASSVQGAVEGNGDGESGEEDEKETVLHQCALPD